MSSSCMSEYSTRKNENGEPRNFGFHEKHRVAFAREASPLRRPVRLRKTQLRSSGTARSRAPEHPRADWLTDATGRVGVRVPDRRPGFGTLLEDPALLRGKRPS